MLYVIATWENGNRRMFVTHGSNYAEALIHLDIKQEHARIQEFGHVLSAWELTDTFETLEQFEFQFADFIEIRSMK